MLSSTLKNSKRLNILSRLNRNVYHYNKKNLFIINDYANETENKRSKIIQ
jgi:hypothetical protein